MNVYGVMHIYEAFFARRVGLLFLFLSDSAFFLFFGFGFCFFGVFSFTGESETSISSWAGVSPDPSEPPPSSASLPLETEDTVEMMMMMLSGNEAHWVDNAKEICEPPLESKLLYVAREKEQVVADQVESDTESIQDEAEEDPEIADITVPEPDPECQTQLDPQQPALFLS